MCIIFFFFFLNNDYKHEVDFIKFPSVRISKIATLDFFLQCFIIPPYFPIRAKPQVFYSVHQIKAPIMRQYAGNPTVVYCCQGWTYLHIYEV